MRVLALTKLFNNKERGQLLVAILKAYIEEKERLIGFLKLGRNGV